MQTVHHIPPRVQPAPSPAANPRDGWPAWTDSGRWAIGPEPEPARSDLDLTAFTLDGPRPTVADGYTPSVEEELWHVGYALAVEGEEAELHDDDTLPIAEMSRLALEFARGFVAGRADRERAVREDREAIDEAEYAAWLDEREREAFTDPAEGWHDAELIRAVGVVESRRA